MNEIYEIRSLVAKYLKTLDHNCDEEMFMTDRGFADWQLERFLAWLKKANIKCFGSRINDKMILCRNCKYQLKPSGAGEDYHHDSICTNKRTAIFYDYIIGRKFDLCRNINTDGKCKFFKGRDK